MAGRPRLPIEIKRLRGTLQKSRAPKHLVEIVDGFPPPPAWFSPRAAEIYMEHQAMIVAANVHSAVDVTALIMLSLRMEEIQICTLLIEDLGRIISKKGASGRDIDIVNPAIQQRSDAMRHAQQLLNDFGLSPAARARVSANGPKKAVNRWLDI